MLSARDRVNKYEVLGEIAQGGEAVVYRARDTFTQNEVALKVIHERNVRLEPDVSKLFLREGKILAELDNDGIIKIYESNVALVNGKEYFYHAMELIEDPTLDVYLKEHKLGWREIVRILRAIAVTIDFLHNRENPILHRDLKPSNIFILDSGDEQNPARIKIFDFGLAKSEFEKTLTRPDEFRGTLRYAAPERVKRFSNTSKASDIYSLGIIIEDMLGEEVAKDVPKWLIDLKKLMCDGSEKNRPSAEEVVEIVDEQMEVKSWISRPLTKLVSLRNKVRIMRYRRMIVLITTIVVLICIVSLIKYAISIYQQNIDWEKGQLKILPRQVILPSTAIGLDISGDYVYVTDGEYLIIIDVNPPIKSHIIKKITTPGTSIDVCILNGYAFVADMTAGLTIADVSSPKSPQIIKSIETPGDALAVDVYDGYAYVADNLKGLAIIDIDPIDKAYHVKNVKTPKKATCIDVADGYAYVSNDEEGLQVIDIDPIESAGERIKNIPTLVDWPIETEPDRKDTHNEWPNGICVAGDYAYVPVGAGGTLVFDIVPLEEADENFKNIDPPNQSSDKLSELKRFSLDVYVEGNYAYIAKQNSGLQIWDISSPDNMTLIGSLATGTNAAHVVVSGNYAYITDMGASPIPLSTEGRRLYVAKIW